LPQPGEGYRVIADLVGRLMGKRPEDRFAFIQDHAEFVDKNALDV
jgi:topoisomerase-4 subunit B